MNVRSYHFTPIPKGYSPLTRPIVEHLKYGVINLDKPANPSSHEIVAWVKKILKVEKTGNLYSLVLLLTFNYKCASIEHKISRDMTDKRMIFFLIKKLFFYSFKLKFKPTFTNNYNAY